VERAVAAVAPAVPLFAVERLSEATGRSVAEPRLLARTLSAFALLAVVLAGIGLYGVIAFSLAERTREMGIRIALGAQAGQVVAMVLRQGAKLGAASLVVGLAGALGLSRVVASRLYGVSSLDPGTYALAAVLLAILVLAASAAPALRAAQSDPIVALRAE
jgi:putative ABC transport system permease protein